MMAAFPSVRNAFEHTRNDRRIGLSSHIGRCEDGEVRASATGPSPAFSPRAGRGTPGKPSSGGTPACLETTLPAAVGQALLLDGEDRALLDRNVADDAGPAFVVGQLDVVEARRDADDLQPLIVIDGPVRVVLGLVVAELARSGGRKRRARKGGSAQPRSSHPVILCTGYSDRCNRMQGILSPDAMILGGPRAGD
jgi:hypothetical protein